MISELLQLADMNRLTGCESTRRRRIHWFIDLDFAGQVVGFSPTVRTVRTKKEETREDRGKDISTFANYHMQVKEREVTGVRTNQNNWLPEFLCGKIDEVMSPPEAAGKVAKQNYSAWCALVSEAATANPGSRIIEAVSKFVAKSYVLDDLLAFTHLDDRDVVRKSLSEKGETIAFRVQSQMPSRDPAICEWWTQRVRAQKEEVGKCSPNGADAYQEGDGPLTESFPRFVGNVALASFDKAPFVSYGLKNQTTALRIETAEKCAAAMGYLLDSPSTSMRLGEYRAVFWAQPLDGSSSCEAPFVTCLAQADPLQVRDFFAGVWGSHPKQMDSAPFHAALLYIPTQGQGRFSVHSWHTETLRDAETHMRAYFDALSLGIGENETPAIWQMAIATVAKSKKNTVVPAATAVALFNAALFGVPLPHRLFACALSRQQTELAKGIGDKKDDNKETFERRLAARSALIKLYFTMNKKEEPMTAEKHEGENHPAYLCGRLLAMLDKIHNEAHDKKSASSPAGRYYAAASKTPALVFPQLCTLVRYHLEKIGGGWAHNLEHGIPAEKRKDGVNEDFEGLAAVVARLKAVAAGSFPRMLSLEEQGRFAIGFYYERVRKWPKTGDSSTTNEDKEG